MPGIPRPILTSLEKFAHAAWTSDFSCFVVSFQSISNSNNDASRFDIAVGVELFWGCFEDIVKDLPDTIGFPTHRMRVNFGEEEQRGMILLVGTAIPDPGTKGGVGF